MLAGNVSLLFAHSDMISVINFQLFSKVLNGNSCLHVSESNIRFSMAPQSTTKKRSNHFGNEIVKLKTLMAISFNMYIKVTT